MKIQYKIILVILLIVLSIYAYFKYTTPVVKVTNKADVGLSLCNKDYSNRFIETQNLKRNKLSNDTILLRKTTVDGVSLSVFNGCNNKEALLYSGFNLENNLYFVVNNKFIISPTNNSQYTDEYKDLYYLNLYNSNNYGQYQKYDLHLNTNETLLHYNRLCGEGCDTETRVFSATTTTDGISFDIFDKNKSDNFTVPDTDTKMIVKANKYLRTVKIQAKDFNTKLNLYK